jgi:alpha/beta superfamily hydrolase
MDGSLGCVAMEEVWIDSRVDGSAQPSHLHVPQVGETETRPLLVFLHQWSHDYRRENAEWLQQAVCRGWSYLQPNFRGPNRTGEACGSEKAQQDILDAVDWVRTRWPIDGDRIYLAGVSGGGHLAMLMAAMAPHVFAAVSEWVGISDLAAWYAEHCREGQIGKYARDIELCVGGRPGSSEAVDRQVRLRSPLFHLGSAREVPIDFNAGVTDGHTGSVPIHHTIDAFNVIAESVGGRRVTREEIDELWTQQHLADPTPDDRVEDPSYLGRKIFLRRHAGPSRLTIFEGGHEGIAFAACQWLSGHRLARAAAK